MTPAALVIQDWGQFQSPGSGWEACPFRRARAGAPALQSPGEGFNKTKHPMIVGILDQSLATWCVPALIAFLACNGTASQAAVASDSPRQHWPQSGPP